MKKFILLSFTHHMYLGCASPVPILGMNANAKISRKYHSRRVERDEYVKRILSFFDISKLEREEKERGGLWTSIEHLDCDKKGREESGSPYQEYDEDSVQDHDDIYDEILPFESQDQTKKEKEISRRLGEIDEEIKEHPLRTDEWLLHIKLSPFLLPGNREAELLPSCSGSRFLHVANAKEAASKADKSPQGYNNKYKQQIIKFSKNGYVLLIEDPSDCPGEECMKIQKTDRMRSGIAWCIHLGNWIGTCVGHPFVVNSENTSNSVRSKHRVTKIGKWKMDSSGLSWSIPVTYKIKESSGISDQSLSIARTTLYYHADLHLSKFQEHPRMFRGVVTRDHFHGFAVPGMNIRKDLFRPVIATFTAKGIGKDTVDISYRKRGFGLKGGNA